MVGRKYRHFKDGEYIVTNIAIDNENLKLVVVYRSLCPPEETWIRDLYEFLSEVDHDKYPEVTQKMRFEAIGEKEI